MSDRGSVSCWIDSLKQGDHAAARQLWERYYQQLVQLARRPLSAELRRVADEEDVVQCAFASFCRRAQEGRFPSLHERSELWSLLVAITVRKAANEAKQQTRIKRGGGRPTEPTPGPGEGLLRGLPDVGGDEPTPELAATLAEQLERLLESLSDATLRRVAVAKLEGHTNAEIADTLGCSLSAVERKLRLIRSRLSRWLEGEEL